MSYSKYLFFLLSLLSLSCNLSNREIDNKVFIDKAIDSANNLIDLKKTAQAYIYIDSVFLSIKKPSVLDIWKKYHFKENNHFILARLNRDKRELALADLYADSMLNIIKNNRVEVKLKHEFSISNFLKGDVLLEMEKYEQSYQYFHKGKLLADESKNTCDQSDFNSRFAFLNYVQGKYRQAASLFYQAYQNNLDCKLDVEKYMAIQGALCNAGLSYEHIKMTDSALLCYKKAVSFLEKNEQNFPFKKSFTKVAKGVAYHYMGDVYLDSGNNAKAEEYLKKCIDFNGSVGTEIRNAQIAEVKLARLFLNTGRFKEFNATMKFARASMDSLPSPKTEIEWQKLQIDYFNLTQQYDQAKALVPNYLSLSEKQNAGLRKLNNVDARTEFYNLQKDYELTLLKKEKQLSDLYLVIAVGFTIMALFILYQLWRNGKVSKKNNDRLTLLNKQVTEQNLHLQNALTALEQSQEENKRVMKVVAHDLRSPIGAIVSLAGFMLSDNRLQEEDQHLMGLIQNSGSDSLKFVNELLNREAETIEMEKDSVDLSALLNYCVNLLQYKATEKHQKIVLTTTPITFSLNREKIWRVMSNLITNAVKFSPKKSTIEVNMGVFKNSVLISVKDQGIGIPEQIKEKIFDMTEEAKRSGTAGEKSFGMGLVISKQIIEAHGGKIWFNSIENKGTTFFVELPL
ncbi:tetratricopeptide repeat-containing sensor histidine kinase [Pedobacter fastidiosus]|uniref:tetratricopeptide repeat-containing sensor histidine kinase n=1 Tax=Pedobacter fastidiosus TaxID=2765361 RepID=UPI00164DADEF|nr:HAMP domain-containing sensor histidine kinase [Pedobacter fastidiosus]